jgi:hypothetical protein
LAGQYTKKSKPREKESQSLDFSPRAIQKEVVKSTAQKPYVLYPLAVGILGALAAAVIEPSFLTIIAAIGGSAVGLGAWLFNATLRREVFANRYLNKLRETLSQRVDHSIRRLENDLVDVDSQEGLNQLDRLQGKFKAFQHLLHRKLDENELTYGRYLGMTEQVFLAGLDNLKLLSDLLKGTSAIDEGHLARRILQLESSSSLSQSEGKELATLQERQGLLYQQKSKAKQLLAQNEEAMTKIDVVMANVGGMESGAGHATMDMESAMQELERLAKRTTQ